MSSKEPIGANKTSTQIDAENVPLEMSTNTKDVSTEKSEDNENTCRFYRLVGFLVTIAPDVIRQYFRKKILKNTETFQEYLNRYKHVLFHLNKSKQCCQCQSKVQDHSKTPLSKKQFEFMFKYNNKKKRSHEKRDGKRLQTVCICNIEAIDELDITVLDVTLAHTIMKNCCEKNRLELGVDHWMERITKIRNKVFHLSSIGAVSSSKYEKYFADLSSAVLGLANSVDVQFYVFTEKRIQHLQTRLNFTNNLENEETLCRECWRDMCTKFEKNRLKKLSNYERLYENATKNPDTMSKIDSICSITDDVTISVYGNKPVREMIAKEKQDESTGKKTISVFIQIEVPDSWDRSRMIYSIEEMAESSISDLPFKITSYSTDDLDILVEFWKNAVTKVDKLQADIKRFMHELVTMSEINAEERHQANVNVNLLIDNESNNNDFQDELLYSRLDTSEIDLVDARKHKQLEKTDIRKEKLAETNNENTNIDNTLNQLAIVKEPSANELVPDHHQERVNINQIAVIETESLDSDNGTYRLRAEGDHELQNSLAINMINSEVTISVCKTEENQQNPQTTNVIASTHFIEHLQNITAHTGASVAFKCKTEPKQVVIWLFNDREMSEDFGRFINHLDGTHVLEIKKTLPKHAGRYTCTCGGTSTSAQLSLKEPESVDVQVFSDDPVGRTIFHLCQESQISDNSSKPVAVSNITGGAIWMKGKCLVLVDNTNSRLLKCNDSGNILDTIPIDNDPHGAAINNEFDVAVSFPSTKYIELYNIAKKKHLSTITAKRFCYSIAYIGEKLVAVCRGHGILLIRRSETKTMIKIKNSSEGDAIFATKKCVFYTNYQSKYIACYNESGNNIFKLDMTNSPLAITLITDNIAYVACENGAIVHVKLNDRVRANEIKTGFESLCQPSVILYDKEKSNLYIIHNKTCLNKYEQNEEQQKNEIASK